MTITIHFNTQKTPIGDLSHEQVVALSGAIDKVADKIGVGLKEDSFRAENGAAVVFQAIDDDE